MGGITAHVAAQSVAQGAGPQPPSTQPTPSDDQVNAVARQMYCPVCENIPLDVCPTQACIEWRELIRQKLAAGWTDSQIRDYFAKQYGDRVLSEPPTRGLNWLVYVLPPAFFVLGIGVVWNVMRKARRKGNAAAAIASAAVPPPTQPDEDAYLAQFEDELRKKE